MRLAAMLCLFLTACAASDPYSQIAAGEAALEATQVARNVKAEQTRGALDAFSLEQTRYAGEVLAVQAQLEGTREAIGGQETAMALQSTKAAGDLQATSAHATSEVVVLQSTAAYLVQYGAAMSTATAIVNERDLAALTRRRNADRANALRWIGIIFLGAMAGVAIGALVVAIGVVKRKSLAEAAWQFYRAAQVALPAGMPDDNRGEVKDFLYRAAEVAGKDAKLLPRYDAMGLSAERWMRITNRLVGGGALIKVNGRGSMIRLPYRTVGGLYQAVVNGRLTIPPSPTVDIGQYWAQNAEQNGEQDE